MLVSLLKTAAEVKAKIIKFEDRIWITDDSSAIVMRRFWISVDRDSCPLTMVRCFLSQKPVQDVEPLCEFGDLRTYPFNNRERFSGIVDIVKGKAINTIDGIRYRMCKLNPNNIELVEVGEGLSLDIDFSMAPLAPDSVYLVPIKFTVPKIIDFKPLRTLGEIHFTFHYLSHTGVPDMYDCIEEDMVIPIIPILPSDDGGFAVFLYVPPRFQLFPSEEGAATVNIAFDYRGEPLNPMSGLRWELSDLMIRQSRDPLSEQIYFANKRFSFGLTVAGKMVERILPGLVNRELNTLRHRLGRMTKYTWIAIGLGAAGLIAGIVSIFT